MKPVCLPQSMTRRKVNLAYITNHSTRKSTFKSRKSGLMKAAGELSTLCGIDMCAIIFSPDNPEPDVWPSKLGIQRVIARFRSMSESQQNMRMVNQEKFTKQRLTKVVEQVEKKKKENNEKEMTHVMYECLNGGGLQYLSMADLNHLSCLLSQNIRDIERRIELLN